MDADREIPKTERAAPTRRNFLYAFSVILLVAGGVVAVVFAKPVYRWARAHQAASLAEEAHELIAAEKWEEAAAALREANQLRSSEPRVIRVMAEFYSFADLRKQRQTLYSLYENGNHTAGDLRDLILLELRFRNPLKAEELSSDLLRTFGDEAENLKTAVQVAKVRKDALQAEGYLRKLKVLEPENGEVRLQLAETLLESSFQEKARNGWNEIYELASRTDEAGLEALRLIIRKPPFYPVRIKEVQELIQKHPNATKGDNLAALGWRYESGTSPGERSEMLEKAIEETRGRSHSENRDFYFWLNLLTEEDQVLRLLPKEEAFKTPGLLTVYITALLQAERYEEIKAIVDSDEGLEESSEIAFIKAQAAIYLEMSTSRVREYLQESYELALLDKRTEMLSHVAMLADKQGLTDFAETVFEAMSRIPETSLQGYAKLLDYCRRREDLEGMRKIVREVREKVPHDIATVKLSVYFDLLHGVNIEEAFVESKEMLERLPTDEECRVIFSFANYRLGDTAAALKRLEGLDAGILSPSYRAVYAAIVGASGDELGAVVVAEKLPRSLLLKEELQLVSKWLY